MTCPECGDGRARMHRGPVIAVGDGPVVKLPDENTPQPVWYECGACGHEARPSAFGIDVAPMGLVEMDPPGSA